jgi:phenylpropionate dioxygenase-like ring-hydroxylating dioxygenase large terminal subunit
MALDPDSDIQGEAFRLEQRTLFSTEWLPRCCAAQLPRAGDFNASTVGGWPVFGVRDNEAAIHVLRNACPARKDSAGLRVKLSLSPATK